MLLKIFFLVDQQYLILPFETIGTKSTVKTDFKTTRIGKTMVSMGSNPFLYSFSSAKNQFRPIRH